MKIFITGGSGFIGTNLVEQLSPNAEKVINYDICKPRNLRHLDYWVKGDINDLDSLTKAIMSFGPTHIIHLAAETRLSDIDTPMFYKSNTEGVDNLVTVCKSLPSATRVIFASSMLVKKLGSIKLGVFEYDATTPYGESKVYGEKAVRSSDLGVIFSIIRPTSIWGEWFGSPYISFFETVLSGRFFHPGSRACTKTYGYIGNSVLQIEKILIAEKNLVNGQVFYIGDYPPINISEWANEIAYEAGIKRPAVLPVAVFKLAGLIGDFLVMLFPKFPLTSFRVNNMTTDNVINLSSLTSLGGLEKYSRLEGVRRTLEWMNKRS